MKTNTTKQLNQVENDSFSSNNHRGITFSRRQVPPPAIQ